MALFGNSVDFSGVEKTYEQSQQQILDAIKNAQAQGRTDIADALTKSLNLNQPYISTGQNALNAYADTLGIGPKGAAGISSLRDQFQQSAGFQYAVQQANLAAQRRANAMGQGMSGAETRELAQQSQGLASQDWTNWLSNTQNRLSELAGVGQRSAMQQAGFENQGGLSLANLGLDYSRMSTEEMQAAAKAKAEAQMAEQVQNSQSLNNWLGGIGSLAGAGAGFFLGGGMPGAALGAQLGGGLSGGANKPNYSSYAMPYYNMNPSSYATPYLYSNTYGTNPLSTNTNLNNPWQSQINPSRWLS